MASDRELLEAIADRLDRIEHKQDEQGRALERIEQEHGARLARIEAKVDAVDNRVSDLRRDLVEQGMVAPDDAPEEAIG